MKKYSSFFFFMTILFVFMVVAGSGYSQNDHFVKVDFNQTNLQFGSRIVVPVRMTGNQIANFRHIIKYDHEVLTYVNDSVPPTSKIFGTGTLLANANHSSYPGAIYLAFTMVTGSFNYTNDEIVYYMFFTYNGGVTNFTWWPEALITPPATQPGTGCFLKNVNGGVPAYWLGTTGWQVTGTGTVTGTSPVLTSVIGGGDWDTPATWLENAGGGTKVPSIIYDVIISQNVVTVNSALGTGKCHNLTINNGGRLTLNSGKTLSPTGTFTIQSNGSFIDQNVTSSNNLAAKVKRNITGNYPGNGLPTASTIWHYVSSPVSNSTIGVFLGCLLNKWTEGSTLYGGNWDTLCLPLTLPLEVGRGYAVAAFPAFGDAQFNGPLNTGNIVKSGLTNTNPANIAYGYNLLGNPYASGLKWDAAIGRTNVEGAIYLWNGTTYITKTTVDNYEIQPEQGFFVHATASGASVTLMNSNRVHSSGSFLKSTVDNQLTLTVTGNELSDETIIRFNEQSSAGFDSEFDAYKLFGVYNCPQIFSILPEFNLSINSLPAATSQEVIPVGFKSGVSGTYTITATDLASFQTGTELYLTDLFTGHMQNLLTNPVYTFTASPANPEHRFDITFSPVGVNDTKHNINYAKIYAVGKTVFVNTPFQIQGSVIIYDLLGREIVKQEIESNTLNKIQVNTLQGYYLVKVVSDQVSATEKVFIR